MKIGVLGLFYGCADLVPRVLAPWIELRARGEAILAGVNAQFTEYAEMGIPDEDTATRKFLKEHAHQFDFLHFSPKPLTEREARGIALEYLLSRNADLVWILDGDELYTAEQIRKILDYVQKTPQFDYYHLNLDNRIFETMRYGDFFPPRIFRTNRHGGIESFVFDNEIRYKDGTSPNALIPGIVPKRVAHILHYTWSYENAAKKIAYNLKHFGSCPFRYDETAREIDFDPRWFRQWNLPVPVLRAGEDVLLLEKPPVKIELTLSSGDPERERSALVVLVGVLLVLERKNDYEISLAVRHAPMGEPLPSDLADIFEICPFQISTATVPSAHAVSLTEDECLAGHAAVFQKFRRLINATPSLQPL